MHSVLSDEEADELILAWEIVSKEKQVKYLGGLADNLSVEAWMDLFNEAGDKTSRQAWRARYASRANAFQYAHLFFILRKAA